MPTAVPTVQLTQPAGDVTVQKDEFLVAGTVATGGAPIESASIVNVCPQGGVRQGPALPVIDPSGRRHLRPCQVQRALVPGREQARRHGEELPRYGLHPRPSCHMEPDFVGDDVPAARARSHAGRPAHGDAGSVERVQLRPACRCNREHVQANVRARLPRCQRRIAGDRASRGPLTASRPDGSLPGVLRPNSRCRTPSRSMPRARCSLPARRSRRASTLSCPGSGLAPAGCTCSSTTSRSRALSPRIPCVDCDNPGTCGVARASAPRAGNRPLPRFPRRSASGSLGVPYMSGDHAGHPSAVGLRHVDPRGCAGPIQPQTSRSRRRAWRRLASPASQLRRRQCRTQPVGRRCCPRRTARTRFYGLIPDNGNKNFVGGCSEIAGQFGSGPAGPLFPEATPWDTRRQLCRRIRRSRDRAPVRSQTPRLLREPGSRRSQFPVPQRVDRRIPRHLRSSRCRASIPETPQHGPAEHEPLRLADRLHDVMTYCRIFSGCPTTRTAASSSTSARPIRSTALHQAQVVPARVLPAEGRS